MRIVGAIRFAFYPAVLDQERRCRLVLALLPTFLTVNKPRKTFLSPRLLRMTLQETCEHQESAGTPEGQPVLNTQRSLGILGSEA
jgi:hypothetical protein